jgi:hypothetical protein
MVLYILICKFLGRRQEERTLNRMVASISQLLELCHIFKRICSQSINCET